MYRKLFAAIPAALVVIGLSACAAGAPSAKPIPPTPTTRSPSAKVPAKPSRSPAPPKPTPTPTKPRSITQPARLPSVKGRGPAGSAMGTGGVGVALTFDDGPDPIYTPQLLDLLKKQRVKATFCLIGSRAERNPSLVRRIVAEGHTLCNHTWNHSLQLGVQTDAVILKDLQDTNKAIRQAVPRAKIKYFRAPGGMFTPKLVGLAQSLGMSSIYWSVDTRDWDKASYGTGSTMVTHIIDTVQWSVRPGAIVLAHDLRKPDTITAFRTLVPWLKQARLKLIALPT